MIVKGRNRDTAWYSMLDTEWPVCKRAFEDGWTSRITTRTDNNDKRSRKSESNKAADGVPVRSSHRHPLDPHPDGEKLASCEVAFVPG